MADSEGEENTMHTSQPGMVRRSLESTAHPDVYARRNSDLRAQAQDASSAAAEREALDDLCTCPVTTPDADGNCDLIEQDDCPLHGKTDPFIEAPMRFVPGLEAHGRHVPDLADLGRRREGWRGRLAHIELLLRTAYDDDDFGTPPAVTQALAEVRAMIDEA